ncbi:hypothetical protein OIO90_003012 [Microbotryomycetes sp. JL221]|nr:hypothetical protein OIO90_003012 [Microbotryomycetes sp. JL221]
MSETSASKPPQRVSSSSSSPSAGNVTPPSSTQAAMTSSQPARSPLIGTNTNPNSSNNNNNGGTTPLASPSGGNHNQPLPSPGGSNRFGLALNFIGRRPRGWSTSNGGQTSGGKSPGAGPASPSNESGAPPSPSNPTGGGGERSSYGFPALRRTLSKRAQTNSTDTTAGIGPSQTTTGGRLRGRSRSSSQPPSTDATTLRNRVSTNVGGSSSAGTSQDALPNTVISPVDTTDPPIARASTTAANDTNETSTSNGTTYRLRLVPHLESSRSLHFEPVDRDLTPQRVIKVGRFTDRSQQQTTTNPSDASRIAFKSKVVSRGHAEIWVDEAGKFFIKDTKSSSGTFLNHIRLSAPNVESRAFPLKDGDVLQLGVDYQGGTEEIYRCVKMRVELNRAWQRSNNAFNTAALAQIRALGGSTPTVESKPANAISSGTDATKKSMTTTATTSAAGAAAPSAASITDCCICLYPVTVCQALFIAPCSHVTHYKCIRPLVMQNYPGFCCPLCRTYADLEADVEVDLEPIEEMTDLATTTVDEEPPRLTTGVINSASEEVMMTSLDEVEEPPSHSGSRAGSIRSRPSSIRHHPQHHHQQQQQQHQFNHVENSENNATTAAVATGRNSIDAGGVMSGLSQSRPASLNEQQAQQVEFSTPASLPAVAAAIEKSLPMSLSGTGLGISDQQEQSSQQQHQQQKSQDVLMSLENAATPPNNTFLSTLADGQRGLPRIFTNSNVPRQGQVNIGLEQALLTGSTTAPVVRSPLVHTTTLSVEDSGQHDQELTSTTTTTTAAQTNSNSISLQVGGTNNDNQTMSTTDDRLSIGSETDKGSRDGLDSGDVGNVNTNTTTQMGQSSKETDSSNKDNNNNKSSNLFVDKGKSKAMDQDSIEDNEMKSSRLSFDKTHQSKDVDMSNHGDNDDNMEVDDVDMSTHLRQQQEQTT